MRIKVFLINRRKSKQILDLANPRRQSLSCKGEIKCWFLRIIKYYKYLPRTIDVNLALATSKWDQMFF